LNSTIKYLKLLKTIGKIITCICCLAIQQVRAQSSVLSEGSWYKLSVKKDGLYKIGFDQLKKMGIDPSKTDPHKIKIFGNGGGMLPQANNAPRISDLTEDAIFVQGESDGQFNKEDYVLFYAQGPDKSSFDVKRDVFSYEKNIYSDKNFYFLSVGTTNGKRIDVNDNDNSPQPVVSVFDDYAYHEVDSYNELESGREWFGENFQINPDQSFKLDFNGIASNTSIKVVSDVMAHSKSNATFNIFLTTHPSARKSFR
jgi:hypothetical protein